MDPNAPQGARNKKQGFGVVEAVGSSPVTPTSRKVRKWRKYAVCGLFVLPGFEFGLCLVFILHFRGLRLWLSEIEWGYLFVKAIDYCLLLCYNMISIIKRGGIYGAYIN